MKYLSLAESIKLNGDRHKANAEVYLAKGMLKHAAGSLRKAAKNYERASLYEFDPFVEEILGPILNEMNKKIADSVMK